MSQKIIDAFMEREGIKNNISDIKFSNQYYESKGEDGYEDNFIVTFSGISFKHKKSDKSYVFKKGDVWMLPKCENEFAWEIFGFEVNIDKNNKLESAYLLTRSLHDLKNLQENKTHIYNKILQINEDLKHGKKTLVKSMMEDQPIIWESVSFF